jgi:molybdopterin-containing oxidoreductase family iron-sulfur binding subunit
MSDEKEVLNIAEIRERIAGKNGRDYWAALGDLADDPSVRQFLDGPQGEGWDKSVTRRQMLKFMGASLALAGLGACTRQPIEKIFPYAEAPERVIPGRPLYFASVLNRQGVARGVLVESHMGRPTKVEGNPRHPDSLGATDVFMQAEILNLYDPDRLQAVLNEGRISTWTGFQTDMRRALERVAADGGAGLRLLTETVTSPSEAALIRRILAKYPKATWHQYEAAGRHGARAGARLSFGRPADVIYRFDQAERIVALDSDFLFSQPGSLRYTRDYTRARQAEGDRRNRLYSIEPTPTVTGSMADHRFPTRASDVERVAEHLARRLGVATSTSGMAPAWVDAVARDLASHRGRSVVVPGEFQPARVHALAHAMNRALGAFGQTAIVIDSVEAEPIDQLASIDALTQALRADSVELLVMVGGNPAFSAPGNLRFAEALARAPKRVYLGSHRDETARLSHWALPQAHALETWGDARAFDGTLSVQQPLIAPLYDGKSPLELLSVLADETPRTAHDIVREVSASSWAGAGDVGWRKAVEAGIIEGTAHRPLALTPKDPPAATDASPKGDIEISVRPDPSVWDGRHANNGWLQELPRPVTTLTWDNVAQISQADADRWNAKNGQIIEIETGGRKILVPVWIVPGQVAGALTLTLGYGRAYSGRLGTHVGVSVEPLRSTEAPWMFGGAVRVSRKMATVFQTQDHHKMEGREPVRVRDHGQKHEEKSDAPEGEKQLSFFPQVPVQSEDYAWGMAIDLDACVGCNACTIACQSENNIPVVGKAQVGRGREMHWIRIDRYQEGSDENPELLHQPVPCMHCENAPCETVCPVGATTHSTEGLNEMTYNRCVGTRYCSNNCPYKVRRFNFYQFADLKTESLKMMRNPDVTVRDRGVMEKCTFCVQRINAARIDAEKDGRKIKEGDLQTACQQVCPATAIVFGNLLDKTAAVVKAKNNPRNYGLLTELNTRPRTTYLARVRNLNPEIKNV